MDLPTCPSCKQSVLDEDATDCPFCGAPMKGGASSPRSAPPARTARSAAPAKLSPERNAPEPEAKQKPVAEKRPSPQPAKPADDDPFAVDETIGAKAVPLSPKPGPGKSLELKCPMCETVGYVSPKAAGQQVRCCNPKCLVPIFSAPAPKKVEAPPPPPPKKTNPMVLYGGLGAAALVVVGVGVWLSGKFFRAPDELPPIIPEKATPVASGDSTPTADEKKKDSVKSADKVRPADTGANLTSQALKKLGELNLNVPVNRKAFSRRMSAVAFIESGDLEGGRDQLEQLARIGKQTPYEASLPTLMIAWRQVGTAPEEFRKSVAEAKQFAGSLPSRGRYAIEVGIAVAAALVADGQPDEARKMLAAHTGPAHLKQLAAAYQVVQNDGTFDLDTTLIGRTLGVWLDPQETAVTLILAAHDRWDDAEAWAKQSTSPLMQAETTLVWTEAFARQAISRDPATDLARALAAADALPPAAKARILARLAAVRLEAGKAEAAEELLQQATQLISAINAPAPLKLQGAKSILDLKLPDEVPLRLAALAAAEVGVVRAEMKQNDAAWNSFQTAFRYLRGSAPGLSFAQQRQAQSDGGGAEKIRAELKSALQLKTDDQIRLQFQQYRDRVKTLVRAATQRFQQQAELLEIAARIGLADQVWDEIQKAEVRPDAVEREPFLASGAPSVLEAAFKAAGNADLQQAVEKAAQAKKAAIAAELQTRIVAELARRDIDSGKVNETLQLINSSLSSDTGALHEESLQLCCRLVKAGKIAEAIKFASGLKDTLLREDGLYIVAALAARTGHATDIWKRVTAGMPPTEAAAVSAGMVTGLAHPAKGQ